MLNWLRRLYYRMRGLPASWSYRVLEVSRDTYHRHEIGDLFEEVGDVVVDGFHDQDKYWLVLRHG